MEEIIDKYHDFKIEEIDQYINLGDNLKDKVNTISLSKYCRHLSNFLINYTKFNYLNEFLSDVNSTILNNFDKNKKYISLLITINNILLKMIKDDIFYLEIFQKYESDLSILNNYIYYLRNLNNELYHENMTIVGSNKPDRIYINILIILDTLKNYTYDGKKYYSNDIVNNYFCTLYKLLNFYHKNNENNNFKIINKIIENFPNDDKTNLIYIDNSLKKCLKQIELIDEIKPFIVKNNTDVDKKKKSDKEKMIFPLVIAGSATLTLGFLIKFLEG